MDRGLRAPLSPNEEIALRRVACGSIDVAAHHVQRLTTLALVESHGPGLRLTLAGVQRVELLGGPIVRERCVSPLTAWLPLVTPAPAARNRHGGTVAGAAFGMGLGTSAPRANSSTTPSSPVSSSASTTNSPALSPPVDSSSVPSSLPSASSRRPARRRG